MPFIPSIPPNPKSSSSVEALNDALDILFRAKPSPTNSLDSLIDEDEEIINQIIEDESNSFCDDLDDDYHEEKFEAEDRHLDMMFEDRFAHLDEWYYE